MDKSQISAFVNGFNIDQYRKNVMYDLIVTIIENSKGNKFIANDTKPGNIKIGYQLNNNNYPLLLDKDNKAYVTIPIATLEQLGVIKVGYETTSNTYALSIDAEGNAYTSIYVADANKFGVIKTGYTQNGKNYPVKIDAEGNAYVYVPWESIGYIPAGLVIEDTEHRFVTDTQITYWNDKSANSIIEDSNHRFVTDEQIAYWNSKADSTPPVEPAVAILERE